MKYLSFALLLSLLAAGCNTNPSDGLTPADQLASTAEFAASTDQDTAKYVPLYIHKIPAPEEIDNSVTSVGGFGQVMQPPTNDPTTFLLTADYWMIEGYTDALASRAQRIAATGQWIRFYNNGTFQAGHWDRQTNAGAWYVDNSTGKYPRVTIDSNVDRLDAIWEIQGSSNNDTFVAVRLNEPSFGFPHRPFSARWMRLSDRPTKKQFANHHGPNSIQ